MSAVPFSWGRVRLIAAVTLREALRQKLVAVLALIAVGLVAGVRALRDFNFGASELKFIADFGDGAIAGFGAVLTVTLTAQLFFSEIENRTALTLLAKPVWRTEFLMGKFLGVVVVAAAVNAWRIVPDGTEGWRTAEVTIGGVDTDGLSSQTMEAKGAPGLYFIGECVDVTGWLGGYNFQWAWSSGWAAGQLA